MGLSSTLLDVTPLRSLGGLIVGALGVGGCYLIDTLTFVPRSTA